MPLHFLVGILWDKRLNLSMWILYSLEFDYLNRILKNSIVLPCILPNLVPLSFNRGVVAVSMDIMMLDIDQCPDKYYVPNAFKDTHKCDDKSSYVSVNFIYT
jgi:hypothetical protein